MAILDISSNLNTLTSENTTSYSLTCSNQSTVPWVFYVYQKLPQQPKEIFSLAWFASPYKIQVGGNITFKWSIDYSFVWGNSGTLQPGVIYSAGATIPCDLKTNNQTTFDIIEGAPTIIPPTPGGQAGSLTINMGTHFPQKTFSTGIGMSGQGTFVQQALTNVEQVYTPEPKYYVAAATEMQMGIVLAQSISMTAKVEYSENVYAHTAILQKDNSWNII